MMMPANYSVVAENEMTYVVGGGLADVLAPVMTAENWQNVIVNTISIVGSSFVENLFVNSLKEIFTFDYNNKISGLGDTLGNLWNPTYAEGFTWGNVANGLVRTVGVLSGIYTLGLGRTGMISTGSWGFDFNK